MEGTLLVTPEKLQSTASSFQSKATQVKGLHDNMITKVNSLSGSWTGEAASAYNSKFTALQTSMDKIFAMITEHVTDLNNMADQYNFAENAAQSAANDLPTSTLE